MISEGRMGDRGRIQSCVRLRKSRLVGTNGFWWGGGSGIRRRGARSELPRRFAVGINCNGPPSHRPHRDPCLAHWRAG